MREKEASRKNARAPKSVVRRELLKIDGRAVEVNVKLNPRARRLIVKVHPVSGEVSVIAPSKHALERAIEFARGESTWIARQLAHVPQRVALRAGARIPLRGREHLIASSEDAPAPVWVDQDAGVIHIRGRAEHTPRRLHDFLKLTARQTLEARSLEFAARLNLSLKRITVRDTATRWGSCSSTRSLSYSWRLIFAPPFVLDYVVAHEVAHLREMNHGPKFWKLVRELVCDVEKPQSWLRRHGAGLHRYTIR